MAAAMPAANCTTPPLPPNTARGPNRELCVSCLYGQGAGAGAAAGPNLPRLRQPLRAGRGDAGRVDGPAVCRGGCPGVCGGGGHCGAGHCTHCQSKATDPAVVVLDECGRFAVPLLSGHLGGANDLARRLAAACGAVPVITTATDANGLFAVDEWAKKQNCAVWETPRIKLVSGALLAGKTVRYASPGPLRAPCPPVWRKPKNRLALILP